MLHTSRNFSSPLGTGAETSGSALLVLNFLTASHAGVAARYTNLQHFANASLSKVYVQSQSDLDAHSPGTTTIKGECQNLEIAVELDSGDIIPVVGLGTLEAAPGFVAKAVRWPLEAGYRHIDCASIYENEAEIGSALARAFEDGLVRRSDVFITSKLW